MYRSTYSLSLSYGAASRGCGEDRESNAVRRSLRIVAQGDPLLLGRGVRRCICPGRLAFPRPRALPLFRAPALASRRLAGMLVDVAAGHGLVVLRALLPNTLARTRILAPHLAAISATAAAVVVLVLALSGPADSQNRTRPQSPVYKQRERERERERETERPRRGGARLGNSAAARGAAASSRDDRLVPADRRRQNKQKLIVGEHDRGCPRE